MNQAVQAHQSEYGSQPDVVVSAPGRIHLLGEHSWYFKDKTLSLAVDLPVYVLVSLRQDNNLRFYFHQLNERKRSSLPTMRFRKEDRWANAFKGVLSSFLAAGYDSCGMNVTIYSDVLPSAGFGVNSAIKAAAACALRKLIAPKAKDEALVEYIDSANRFFMNTTSCLADIFTPLFAKKNTCILTNYNNSSFEFVPFEFPDTSFVLTDAKVPRVNVWNESTLWTAEYACLLGDLKISRNGEIMYEDSDVEINEVLSVVNEDYRRRLICIMKEQTVLLDAVAALKNSNFAQFARGVARSHELLRDLYQISCPEVDWLVKRVFEADMLAGKPLSACSRITGKGSGSSTYTILQTKDLDAYEKRLAEYERIFGFHAICYNVKTSDGVISSRKGKV
ncbi:MAG: galactokinase [Spirochaetaceae bacterium]|nr:galactokinase [Spirochaetaceae bacterium]